MELKYEKIYAPGTDVGLKVTKGHFATNHAHTNYYIDLTTIKSRVSEAQEIARALVHMYLYDMVVDTIVCMEGTEVIGTLLAEELTKGGFLSLNAHKTIYIIKPEFNSNSQIMFKDNFRPMLNGKNVILLTATVTTGLTINKGIEGIQYYGGIIQSVSAVFSALDEMNGAAGLYVQRLPQLSDLQGRKEAGCADQSIRIFKTVNGKTKNGVLRLSLDAFFMHRKKRPAAGPSGVPIP